MLYNHVKSEKLVPLLTDFKLKTPYTPIHAVVGYRKYLPQKQRVFIAFLKDELAKMPWSEARS